LNDVFLHVDPAVEPSGGASGQASDIAIHAKEILRVRESLTAIYQKHCSREEESKQDALQRFSMYHLFFLWRGLYDLLPDTALERDYFLNGT
jgi:ATP-dependent Clp protease, protease subunit